MTSKTSLRSCEDMDATALSFAEIKALCAGNPLIKEKTDLDMQVRKLRLLKSNYQSQHFKLEDSLLKKYPARIKAIENSISSLESDIALLQKNTVANDKGFSPMTIGNVVYSDKEDAGKALLLACKELKTSKYDLLTEPQPIGSYRGMQMGLSFNGVTSTYRLTLHGNKDYIVELGKDVHGNITRINNALDGLPKRIEDGRAELVDIRKQIENANAELARPFEQEQELADKVQRLAEVDAALNLDEPDYEVLDYEVEQPSKPALDTEQPSEPATGLDSRDAEKGETENSYNISINEDTTTNRDIIKEDGNMMNVLLVKPGEMPKETEISGDLASMQQVVDGSIQAVYPFEEDAIALVCNEEGKLDGLPLNRALYGEDGGMYDIIAGDFFICGLGSENFASLPPELLVKYTELFKHPEKFIDIAGQIVAVKQPVPKQKEAEKSKDIKKSTDDKTEKPKSYEPEL